MTNNLDFTSPLGKPVAKQKNGSSDNFGKTAEWIARAMGTATFLIILTLFCVLWLGWNVFAPEHLRFDSAVFGFTALTLMLSLQASYAAPLILLAQNRQDDRDRVQIAQERERDERTLADVEYLTREVVALRLELEKMASKEFIRQELGQLAAELKNSQNDQHDN